MDIKNMIIENTTQFIAIITLTITIASQILSTIVYFRTKGRLDYYYVDKSVRSIKKYDFNYEYIVTGLFIAFIVYILIKLFTIEPVRKIIDCQFISTISILFISIIVFAISYFIYYLFSYEDIAKKIRLKNELKKYVMEKSFYTTIKYFMFLLYIYNLCYLMIHKNIFLSSIVTCLIIIYEIFYEYITSKILVSKNRIFNIINIKKEKRCVIEKICNEKYCVIEKICNEKYYAVKVTESGNNLKLHLDKWRIISYDDLKVKSVTFPKHERYFNKEFIK